VATARAVDPSAQALSGYLGRVGRRVLWFKLARGSAFALGWGLLLLLGAALLAGPSIGLLGAILTWGVVVAGVLLAGTVGVGRLEDLSGARRATLLSAYDRRLSERARSAAELSQAPNGSPELVAALTRSVMDELTKLPVRRVVARPRHWGRMSSASAVIGCACALFLASSEQAASGLYALTHPARDDGGVPQGLWISSLSVTITFPESRGGGSKDLASPHEIAVPEGSELALSVLPRFAVDRAVLVLDERTLPMTRGEDGRYRLTLTAEKSGELAFRARIGEAWITDSEARALVVDQDSAPEVTLEAPLADAEVSPDEPVPFVFAIRDDHGLEGVDLVVQMGPGRERRRRLSAFAITEAVREHRGNTEVTPREFGADGGQTLVVWIEARDRDTFGGPNVGRSAARTITVGERQDAGGSAPIELLERTRDLAVDTLGERLERAMPGRSGEAEDRADGLAKGTRTLIRQLESLATAYAESDGASAGVIRDMMQRLSRLTREEGAASELRKLRERDEAMVAELEDDVLWLSDLIGKARLQNAEQVLERLTATRARMRELLEQLKRTNDPARKAELMAEIARARAELGELAKKLAQAQEDVPSDFVNYEALAEHASQDPLADLEKALESGDMEAAERALAELDEQLAGLEDGMSSGGEAFADARFSPRSAAARKAQAEVRELSRSQKQLANETGRVADAARARGTEDEAFKEQAEGLAREAEGLEKRTRGLEAGRMQPAVSEAQAAAAQRLRDARDALKQGDADEAKQMAERAADDLGALASEMSLDARMHPGADGSRSDAAKKAQQLSRDASKFADEVRKIAPGEPEDLSSKEQAELRGQAPQQEALGEAAERLSRELEDAPPSVNQGLERARDSMKRAADALDEGDVREAEAHQRDALDQLGELNEELSRSQKASSRGKRREGDSGEHMQSDERVAIPTDGNDPRRKDLRRRVLDARRARTPTPYSRAVDRYYQEILR
jgi:hypothetical protein